MPSPTSAPGDLRRDAQTVTIDTAARPPAGGRRRIRDFDTTGRQNMQQLIELRWIAVLGQVATISVVHFGLGAPLPVVPMLAVLFGLVAFNALSLLRLRFASEVSNTQLFVALLVDVGMLSAQLYLSGGAANPFVFLYLLQVTLGAVLLEVWSTWLIVLIATLCFAGLAVVGSPLALPADHAEGLGSLYVQGMLICFVINATLLVTFITRIMRNLRARDERLADLRQRAAEEDHIVRMGLLASGAAHELGTPLATLAVILSDWKRMEPFASDPELLQELGEMQTQVQRCKSIVSGILLSAGEARGEAPMQTTVRTFLDDLVQEWRATRPVRAFDYHFRFGQDQTVVSDSAIKQMICNVLDNALEASPDWVSFEVRRDAEALVLTVADEGPGFHGNMLERLGKPYQSTKGRPGSGLGLFLVVNVLRTLGGRVTARNRPQGGAEVVLSLPLAAITLEETQHASEPR